jgi:hypothetical protein
LCASCHDLLKAGNVRRFPMNADGSPGDPRHPWNARP